MIYSSNVNGFLVEGEFDDDNVSNIFIPLVKNLIDLQKKENRRIICFISAPPAVGKSTLVNFLVHLANTVLSFSDIQAIGIDGFHYYNDYLTQNNLMQRKGAIDTFNSSKLCKKLEELKENDTYFPIYDRNLHEPIEDKVLVEKNIILLEGNYLATNKWEFLNKFCDYSVFISADESDLKNRLVERKVKGGKTYKQAEDFYEQSDSLNIRYVLENSTETDMILKLSGFKYIKVKEERIL